MAPLVFAGCELRKDFIMKNYCVNKSRPELHCDGKSYLAKQLEKAEQENQKQATGNFITKLLSFESEIKNNLFADFFLKNQLIQDLSGSELKLKNSFMCHLTFLF